MQHRATLSTLFRAQRYAGKSTKRPFIYYKSACLNKKIYSQRQMEQQDGRHTKLELLVQRLMVPGPHADPRSYRATDSRHPEQRRLRNPPLGFLGLVFIYAIHYERNQIDYNEIND